MNDDQTMAATPHAELLAELMNPNIPKNEREHAAVREIERLREALAQPEHSATYQKINLSLLKHSDNCRFWDEGDLCTCGASEFHELQFWKNKALAQPEMRPDEISTDELIYMSGRYDGMKQERALWELSRLGQEIEAQPEQEPTGCACRWDDEGDRTVTCARHEGWLEVIAEWADRAREAEKKLKALAQPEREWVGLTDEEIAQGCKESWVTEQAWQSAVWWAEATLKEKNT